MEFDRELPFSLNTALEFITPFSPFPTEILLNIFEFACITSAKTARTLCLISKHVNALATPLLFRSISACGNEEMQGLVGCLEKNSHIPPMVRHLFLSRCGLDDYRGEGCGDYDQPDERFLFFHTSHRIIALLSPFLETFSYIAASIKDHAHFTHILSMPLPRLRELTIEGRLPQFPVPIPSLQRLHVYTRDCYSLTCNLDERFPRLTHLKLSGLTYDGESIEIGLKRNQGILDAWEIRRAETVAPLCLPLLHFLIIQPIIAYDDDYYVTGYPLRKLWKRLAQLGETGLGPIVLRVEESLHWVEYCRRAHEDWLDRIEGEEGCWKLRRTEGRE